MKSITSHIIISTGVMMSLATIAAVPGQLRVEKCREPLVPVLWLWLSALASHLKQCNHQHHQHRLNK